MNVLFICDEYPPGKNGGIGTMIQVLGRELVRQGHNIYVAGLYSYHYGGADFEEDNGVKVWRLRCGLNLKRLGSNRLYNVFEKLPWRMKRNLNGKKAFEQFIKFTENLIEKEQIDVVEIPDWNNFNSMVGFVVKWPPLKAPLIVKSHGSYSKICNDLNIKPDARLAKTDQLLYERADGLIAVSYDTAQKNAKIFSPKKEIKVLYNAIEISNITLKTEKARQTAIFSGSLTRSKGIFQLMKAWNIVNRSLPGAQLIIYGKGKIKPAKKILTNQAIKTVHFKGHVSREYLLSELSKATLAVFPSYSETFGLMCIEAMSVGCPVIYTQRASGPEIINDGENGRIINPDSFEEIAAVIIELIGNEGLRVKYSSSALKTIEEKFSITESAREHIRYYTKVVEEFRRVHS